MEVEFRYYLEIIFYVVFISIFLLKLNWVIIEVFIFFFFDGNFSFKFRFDF